MDKIGEILRDLFDLLGYLLKTSPNASIGVYLLNCSQEIFPLGPISSQSFQILKTSIEDQYDLIEGNVNDHFGKQLLVKLDEIHSHILKEGSVINKVILITDCCKPFNENTTVMNLLQNKLRLFVNDKIILKPFVLPNIFDEDTKEYSKWFDIPNLKFKLGNSKVNFDHLRNELIINSQYKQYCFDLPLKVGQLMISVKGLNLISPIEFKSLKYFTDLETGYKYPILTETKFTSQGHDLGEEDLIKSTKLDTEYLPIYDQVDKIKTYEPMLNVKCSIPISKISPYIVSNGKFLIPNYTKSEAYTKSKEHLAALYNSLLKKEMALVVFGSLTRSSIPHTYYLLPARYDLKTEDLNLKRINKLLLFALIRIPFGDEIRSHPKHLDNLNNEPTEPELFGALTNKLKTQQNILLPDSVVNWKLETIIKLAIGEPVNEFKEDNMQIQIDEARQTLIDPQLKRIPHTYNVIENTTLLTTKKVKREPLTVSNIKLLVKNGVLDTYTLAELKEFIKSFGGKVSGKKGDLIDEIHARFRD